MNCHKCGREYDSTFDKCPYCGAIFTVSGKTKPKGLSFKSASDFKKILIRYKAVLPYVLATMAGIIVAALLFWYFTGVGSKAYKQKMNNITKLEKYCKEGDYESFNLLMDKIKNVSEDRDYDTYRMVQRIYKKSINFFINEKEARSFNSKTSQVVFNDNINRALLDLINGTKEAEDILLTYNSDKDKEFIGYILDYMNRRCKETYKMNDLELEEISGATGDYNELIEAYIDVIYRRFKEIGDAYEEEITGDHTHEDESHDEHDGYDE